MKREKQLFLIRTQLLVLLLLLLLVTWWGTEPAAAVVDEDDDWKRNCNGAESESDGGSRE
jgi:hypothetical protein